MRGDRIEIDEASFRQSEVDLYLDGVRWVPPAEGHAGWIETTGGRVCTVVAPGETVDEARALAYRAAEWVRFRGRHLRRDIGL